MLITTWMAGGGIKPEVPYGATDKFSFNEIENGVHDHDFNAMVLHLMGIDHARLHFKYQDRRFRLTDVRRNVVKEILTQESVRNRFPIQSQRASK
jgi:hypothetical protein